MGFIENEKNGIGSPSLYLTNTKEQYVFYSIEAPGAGYSFNGVIKPSGSAVVSFPTTVLCSKYNDRSKGVYLQSNSSDIIVVGQNMNSRNGDTFLVLPYKNLCNTEYVYYGITTASSTGTNVILIVGADDNTMMNITYSQSGKQYSYVINRLQTFYYGTASDLTGTKITTDKPVTVISGSKCAYHPAGYTNCEQLLEQIPATMYWGKVYYTMPFTISSYYSLKVLAAHNYTTVFIYCKNVLQYSSTINEGKFAFINQQSGNCAIQSNKEILVAQMSEAFSYYKQSWERLSRYRSRYYYRYYQTLSFSDNDPMLTLVPATVHYSHEINLSTSQSSSYYNYINIIVLAEYYQPNSIQLKTNGVNNTQVHSWTSIKYNNIVVAYGTRISIANGETSIVHTNTSASPMTAVVYGAKSIPSYGHSVGFDILNYFPGMYV